MEDERLVEKHFRPLSEPLQQLAQEFKREKDDVKEEVKEEEEEGDVPNKSLKLLKDEYIDKALTVTERGVLDHTYGVKYDAIQNGWVIGSTPITFHDNNTIMLENKKIVGTRGLFELLFMYRPVGYTNRDLKRYKDILVKTKAHLNSRGGMKSNSGFKYKRIIKDLFSAKTGRGIMVEDRIAPTKYIFWDDPNELCDRLRMLIMSKEGGHTGHDVEIVSIIEELREKGYIVSGELKPQYQDVA